MNFYCSPSIKPSKTGCFNRESLIRIANKYNEQNRDKIIFSNNTNDEKLWNLIDKRIEKHCTGGEICWLNDKIITDDPLLKKFHLPLKPEGQYTWLKTSDINSVLSQYEDKYSDFTFMGAVPIDFDIVVREIAFINVCNLINKGKTRIGFVFNLDKHTQKGSHWVCLYMDLYNKDVCYFDSYAKQPSQEIKKLMNKLVKQTYLCTGINIKEKVNSLRHQYKGSECGMYCLYFIYQLLIGKTFEDLSKTVITDDEVNKWRDFFFRKNFFRKS